MYLFVFVHSPTLQYPTTYRHVPVLIRFGTSDLIVDTIGVQTVISYACPRSGCYKANRAGSKLRSRIVAELQGNGKNKKEKTGISLVYVGYRRAKAVMAGKRAVDAGKIVRKTGSNSKRPTQKTQSRTEEMQELF
ncbi:hypothetical protein FH972_013970 [Carpinus fangiana]|uniref:Uncharacterized protein n=1 Tax=Carpinus fangiana TaxID=176857 RepID=A0A5N6RBG4_9ROSI|nr:hypothetical protein FH972_013970 [Carpinus fangiana]